MTNTKEGAYRFTGVEWCQLSATDWDKTYHLILEFYSAILYVPSKRLTASNQDEIIANMNWILQDAPKRPEYHPSMRVPIDQWLNGLRAAYPLGGKAVPKETRDHYREFMNWLEGENL